MEHRSTKSKATKWVSEPLLFHLTASRMESKLYHYAIKIWTASGVYRNNLSGHSDFLTALAFSPHSQFLASGSCDKTVRLWDVTNHANQQS